MPQHQLQRQEQIMTRLLSRTVARSQLSDVGDTSVLKKFGKSHARELHEVYYQLYLMRKMWDLDKAKGDDLDERIKEIAPGTLSRNLARKSVGNLIFGRTGTTGTVSIPTGSSVKDEDGNVAVTTQQGYIIAGSTTSSAVPAAAEEAGADGNFAASTLVKFGAKIPGIDSVTNTTAFSQGRDKETDDSLRNRAYTYLASLARCPVEGQEDAVIGVVDSTSGKEVVFSHMYEDIVDPAHGILYIDDGNGTAESTQAVTGENVTAGLLGPPLDSAVGGEEYLQLDNYPVKTESGISMTSSTRGALTLGTEWWINPANGKLKFDPALSTGEVITTNYTYFDGLIAAAQLVIDGDPNDRSNYPGYRAAASRIRVLAPVVVSINVEAVLAMAENTDRATAVAAAESNVTQYINGLGISSDVILSQLSKTILDSNENIVDVDIIYPTANLTILDNEIARISSSGLSIT